MSQDGYHDALENTKSLNASSEAADEAPDPPPNTDVCPPSPFPTFGPASPAHFPPQGCQVTVIPWSRVGGGLDKWRGGSRVKSEVWADKELRSLHYLLCFSFESSQSPHWQWDAEWAQFNLQFLFNHEMRMFIKCRVFSCFFAHSHATCKKTRANESPEVNSAGSKFFSCYTRSSRFYF